MTEKCFRALGTFVCPNVWLRAIVCLTLILCAAVLRLGEYAELQDSFFGSGQNNQTLLHLLFFRDTSVRFNPA